MPWRKTTDPYKILVSEVMLQQTQVERVVPYYKTFLKKFPTVKKLAQAPLSEVLIVWQGLGYNRRAKMLHEAARFILSNQPVPTASKKTRFNLVFPGSTAELEKLPGVGPYTAGAVAAFAYNHDGIFIETNIRTVVTRHFFGDRESVSDSDVREVLERVHPKGQAREWYAALMDYGAHLKRSGVRINARAKGYTKQSAFAGSAREARGAIVRCLGVAPATKGRLVLLVGVERKEQLEAQLEKLLTEGMIMRSGSRFMLPGGK